LSGYASAVSQGALVLGRLPGGGDSRPSPTPSPAVFCESALGCKILLFAPYQDGYYFARQTAHQVILAPDLSQKPAVDSLAPDGVRLQSTILGIALVDPQRSEQTIRLKTVPL
jgi:hypothetical protein